MGVFLFMAKRIIDKKEMVKEMVKCTQSAEYYLSTYGMVYHPKKGHVKFRLFDYQREELESFQNNRFNIVLKSRQCIPKGTCVDTPSGPVNIENLKIGDEVLSYNFEDKEIVVDEVCDAWKSGDRNCFRIKLKDGRDIEAGENHPFYVEDIGWVKSKDLEFGNVILDLSVARCEKDSTVIEIENVGEMETYDISVSTNENYMINGLVVHNTGISTLTAGYIAWIICFHSAKEIVVVADKQDNAQGFIRKIKTFINKTPAWMVPTLASDNKKSIELTNGSKVSAQATTGNAGRSASLSLLVIDEAAIVDTGKVDDLWASAYPTLSLGGAAIIISTPMGVGNWYHKQWQAAINKESDFTPLIAHWTDNPIYGMDTNWICQKCGNEQNHGRVNQLKETIPCDACGKDYLLPTSPWYEEQKKQLGDPRKVAQELDMDFLGSGENVIREEYIREAEKNCKVPARICGFDNNLWVWKEPEKGVEYLISADVARGDGTDLSGCHVLDINKKEQVAEYRGKLPPDLFA
jgi:hypothetical protein